VEMLLSDLPVLAACLRPDLGFCWVNSAYAEVYGRDPSFFPGKRYFDLNPGSGKEALFRRVLESGQTVRFAAAPSSRSEPAGRDAVERRWRIEPIRVAEGKVTCLLLTSLDLTQSIPSLPALAASRNHYRLLLESAHAIPWEADPVTFRFSYVGPQAVEILGYSVDTWCEDGFWAAHLHPDDREDAVRSCQQAVAECRDHDLEY
jgi:PAS domain-containing protein